MRSNSPSPSNLALRRYYLSRLKGSAKQKAAANEISRSIRHAAARTESVARSIAGTAAATENTDRSADLVLATARNLSD